MKSVLERRDDPRCAIGVISPVYKSNSDIIFYASRKLDLSHKFGEMDISLLLSERDCQLELRYSEGASVHEIPMEILHRIFAILTLIQHPAFFFTNERNLSAFFESTAPYNIACVCRSWRELVLSSASLWTDFSFTFEDPSDRTLNQTRCIISIHLRRSQTLPMTCKVHLFGTLFEDLSGAIAELLVASLGRWRSMKIWFDVEPWVIPHDDTYDSNKVGDSWTEALVPVCRPRLFTQDLGLLEELKINYAGQYRTSFSPNVPDPGSLPFLTRLELEMEADYEFLARWLKIVPTSESSPLPFIRNI